MLHIQSPPYCTLQSPDLVSIFASVSDIGLESAFSSPSMPRLYKNVCNRILCGTSSRSEPPGMVLDFSAMVVHPVFNSVLTCEHR